ncbi:MAG: two-component system nitrogen regulation response regulator GlnG [Paracoccaceae bacterium]
MHDFSDRRSRPYIIAGAADLEMPDQIQAMLISAKAGSILFDEVGDLSLDAQSQLVRALDGLGDNAPRLMASTQQDLGHAVENRSFRSDLYYRLNAVALSAPPLRLRIDDIPILAEYFLAHLDSKGNEGQKFSAEAVAQLRKHTWPGNVRQLEHMVQRLAATCPETTISSTDILSVLGPISPAAQSTGDIGHARLADSINVHITRYFELHGDVLPPAGLYARILKEMETPLLEIALEYTRGNQAKCADLLGINRNTLRKKVTELDINVTRRRKMM